MQAGEPTPESLSFLPLRFFLATRPPFLAVAIVAGLIGVMSARHDGVELSPVLALVSVLFAAVAHAAANLINDYEDARNGTDALNTERLFPFTGGSRFIQNGVLSAKTIRNFAIVLMVLTACVGLWLTVHCGVGLLLIGGLGGLIGWAYSVPPLRLNSRGLGELCIALGFGLIAVGTDYVQRHTFSVAPVVAVSGFALLSTAILFINQFPDRKADALAGKQTLVVRLGANKAAWLYPLFALVGYALAPTSLALLPLPLSIFAAKELWQNAAAPQNLRPAIRATILAALVYGVLVVIGL